MIRYYGWTIAVAGSLLAGCASTSEHSDGEPVVVFKGDAVPTCNFDIVGEIAAVATVRGGRSVAEEQLLRSLRRAAERRGGDGVMGVEITAPDRVPFVVTDRRRPSESDIPAVEWSGKGRAIRFADPTCRAD